MLNEQQREAVDSRSSRIVVIAGAGSGKSTVLLSRISRLVSEGADPSSILALTFTNAAACEMRDRYRKSTSNEDCPMFCTFHAFCYSLIARNRGIANKLGYFKGVPNIADSTDLKRIHTMCVQQCGIKLSEDKLAGKVPLTRSEKFQYDLYWKQYKKMLGQNNLITFDIMCDDVCKLFSSNDPLVQEYIAQYKYVFVDEFQDTDQKQWKFVASFKDSDLFVVGDAKQNLYSFRGTSNEIIKSLAEDPEWETIKLFENYRSTNQICNYANVIHEFWGNSPYNLAIHGQTNGCDVVETSAFRYHGSHATDDIMEIVSDSHDYETTAILCRTNAEVADVCSLLKLHKIPYRTKSGRKPIVHILNSVLDSEYFVDWLSDQLPAKKYNEYVKMCAVDPTYETEDKFISCFGGSSMRRYTEPVFAIRKILETEEFPYGKVLTISKYLRMEAVPVTLSGNEDEDVIEYLIDVAERCTAESNIYVGTIHSVKGLEYDNVHLLGVDGKSFPLQKEEQLNLYYVGCTRAKKKLTIWFG